MPSSVVTVPAASASAKFNSRVVRVTLIEQPRICFQERERGPELRRAGRRRASPRAESPLGPRRRSRRAARTSASSRPGRGVAAHAPRSEEPDSEQLDTRLPRQRSRIRRLGGRVRTDAGLAADDCVRAKRWVRPIVHRTPARAAATAQCSCPHAGPASEVGVGRFTTGQGVASSQATKKAFASAAT